METKKFITDENLKRFGTNVKAAIKTAADDAKKNPSVKTINGVSIIGSGNISLSEIGIDGDIVRVVVSLPELSEASYNKLYLVPVEGAPAGNSYAEYVKVNVNSTDKWEKIGEWKADVKLDKTSVGLGNVDNTSDVDKPVSTAQKTYIDTEVGKKASKDVATTSAAGLMSSDDKTILDKINADYVKSADANLDNDAVDKLWNEA